MKVSLIQLDVTGDVAQNLKRAEKYVKQASGSDIIVLPEAFLAPFGTELDLDLNDFHKKFSGLAEDSLLIAGTVPEEADKVYNTCFAYDGGKLAGKYRKIHLFEAHSDKVQVSEADKYSRGNELRVVNTKEAPVGLAVCYDLRFPEQFVDLAKRGAKIIAVPAAFNYYTGKRDWELLCRARAADSQSYLLACAPAQNLDHFPVYGHSMIVRPDGTILKDFGKNEGILTADIDLDLVDKLRKELPILNGR